MKNVIKFGIAVFTVLLIMTGCDEFQYQSTETTGEDKEMNTVTITNFDDYTYMEGTYSDRVWDKSLINDINSSPQSTGTNISTADMAISIATVEFEKIQQEGMCISYSLGGVFFDVEDQVWIVWFTEKPESDDVILVGSCYNIAISKNSGQIIKSWPSE